jgi:hypothetical protein
MLRNDQIQTKHNNILYEPKFPIFRHFYAKYLFQYNFGIAFAHGT